MCKVIAVAMQKGGCAKTNVSLNLGIGLARAGKKVLLIDNDPQGNLTASLGYEEPDDMSDTLASVMMKIINDEPIEPGYILRRRPGKNHRITYRSSGSAFPGWQYGHL